MKKLLISIPFLILIGIIWSGYSFLEREAEDLVKSEANKIFSETVLLDKSLRGKGLLENFISCEEKRKTNDTIQIVSQERITTITIKDKGRMTFDEKKYIFDQLYLLDKNPIQVDQLDSMFHAMLYKNKLNMKTAIIYKAKGNCLYSCSDSLFYPKATELNTINIGGFIQLQGYVLLSNPVLWSRFPVLGYYFLSSMFLLTGIAIYILTKKRKNAKEIHFPIQTIEKQNIAPAGFLKIRDDLFFKDDEGVILHKEIKIILSKKNTSLLSFLLQSSDGFRSYEELKNNVWREQDVKKDAIRVATNRLNAEINQIPNFYIETVVGKGYHIVIGNK